MVLGQLEAHSLVVDDLITTQAMAMQDKSKGFSRGHKVIYGAYKLLSIPSWYGSLGSDVIHVYVVCNEFPLTNYLGVEEKTYGAYEEKCDTSFLCWRKTLILSLISRRVIVDL